MRLWHPTILRFLPNSQLLAQWRELNSIYVKQDKHILINYIYNYPKFTLKCYSDKVIQEMKKRKFKVNLENYNNYFKDVENSGVEKFSEHNDEYFTICYHNLQEKYLRGQKDYSLDLWNKLDEFYINILFN